MGIRDFIRRAVFTPEQRVSINDPNFWPTLFNYQPTASGQDITPYTAMQVSTVYACVKVLAETMASLPFQVFKRTDEGREVAINHPLYKLIHNKPNPIQSAFEYWEMAMAHVLLRGNHYSFIELNRAGQLSALWPLNPATMIVEAVESTAGALTISRYLYTRQDGKQIIFRPEDIWHLKDISSDGLVGDSRIAQVANPIGLAKATEEHGSKYFANNASPGVLLVYPGKLSENARENLKKSFDKNHAGSGNAYKTHVLEEGLEIKHIGMSMEDSQFLETRRFQVEDIARIFRVPSILIQHPDKTATYASSEQLMLAWVMHTVRPWAKRIENSVDNKFLPGNMHYAEMNLDGLLRGDIKTRYEGYKVGREWGFMSANDIRRLENMNPIGGKGDEYLRAMNMTLAGTPTKVEEPDTGGNVDGDDE